MTARKLGNTGQGSAEHVIAFFLEKSGIVWPMKPLARVAGLFYRTLRVIEVGRPTVKKSRRKFVVFSTLLGVLSLTSALLMALAPAPLAQDAATSLFAVDEPRSMDVIFQTRNPLTANHWKYIYIHHSNTASGNAIALGQPTGGMGDHFLIGNGDGLIDGEIQIGQRWNQQISPAPPPGATKIDTACISICLVGDFDRSVPTPIQLRRLEQLVGTLQAQLHIPRDAVLLLDQPHSPAGAGKYFPQTAFRNQLLP
jgi:hypothetical protein